MKRVFISYSRVDEPFARQLATALSNHNADVWIDVEDIPAGMNWSMAIQQGLDTADALLLVVSPDAMQSENVTDEWQYFLDHNKPVIPIFYRPAKMHFQLHRKQYIDFHEQDFKAAFKDLLDELARQGTLLEAGAVTVPSQAIEPEQYAKPKQTPARPRGPLMVVVAAVLVVIAGLVGGFVFLNVDSGSHSADFIVEDFPPALVVEPISPPAILHYSTTGESDTFGPTERATISQRFWDEYSQEYWYEVDAIDLGETGYQITEFLPISEILLRVVPIADRETGSIVLYQAPANDARSVELDLEGETGILRYGFVIEDEQIWIYTAIYTPEEAYAGWTLDDTDFFYSEDLGAYGILSEEQRYFVENPVRNSYQSAADMLAAGTPIRALALDVGPTGEEWLLVAFYTRRDNWQLGWIDRLSLDFNAATLDYLPVAPA